jgi:predicted ester cyclase
MRAAVPDWRSEADHYIAEGDLVVEHFHAYGRPSYRRASRRARRRQTLTLRGIHIFRIADDKIVERWGRLDDLGLQQQLTGG